MGDSEVTNALHLSGIVGTLLALAACGGSGAGQLGRTFSETVDAEANLVARVDDILVNQGTTDFADLPGGTATYKGFIHGFDVSSGFPTGPDLEYYADLRLNTNFNSRTLTGSITNMVTDLSGFTSPSGSATVNGNITNVGGTANLDFTGSGTFSQGIRRADFGTDSTFGTFVGTAPRAAFGDHESEFDWTAGPDRGDLSFSDGDWNVERR